MTGPPVAPSPRAAAARARPIPLVRWPLWTATFAVALLVFYGILTPFWMALRLAAWVSERLLFRRPAR